jgi:hypothetical protein
MRGWIFGDMAEQGMWRSNARKIARASNYPQAVSDGRRQWVDTLAG